MSGFYFNALIFIQKSEKTYVGTGVFFINAFSSISMIFRQVLVLKIILEQINHPFTPSKPHIIIAHILFHTIDHYRFISDDS